MQYIVEMFSALRKHAVKVEHRIFTALHLRAERERGRLGSVTERKRPAHLITGERGEDEAFFYLRQLGYTIVARRWRSGNLRGDLDLVGWDGDTLVIFEVKTRTARDFAAAEVQVDREKQRMLRRMASAYIRQFPERHRERVHIRFDVISVYLLNMGVEVEHFRAAFTRSEIDR